MKAQTLVNAAFLGALLPTLLYGCASFRARQGAGDFQGAVKGGDLTRVRDLLSQGADPNAADLYGWAPLHFAAYQGRAEVAKALLDAGAKMDVKDRQGFTPLHWAVYESALIPGSAETARILILRGANVDARDVEGSTALFWAAWEGNINMAKLLLDHGANVHLTGKEGLTPLQSARKYEHKEMVALLIKWR